MIRILLALSCAILVSVVITNSSFSWGSGTHLYIAEQLNYHQVEYLKLYNRYGAMAPDMNAAAPASISSDLRYATHYNYASVMDNASSPGQMAFAGGWFTHNEVCGADRYAHYDPGYVRDLKNATLADIIRLDFPEIPENYLISFAEDFIEIGVDLLLEEHDAELGKKITQACSISNFNISSLLSKAYPEFIGKGLLIVEETFKRSLIAYGNAISLESPKDKEAMASIIAAIANSIYGIPVTVQQCLFYLVTAMDLCKESYFDAIWENIQLMQAMAAPANLLPGCAVLWGDIKVASDK